MERRAAETVCATKGCGDIAPIGSLHCPEHGRTYFREYYARNAEAVNERKRQYNQTPGGRKVQRAHGNKRRDLEAEANYADLRYVDDGVCYICGQVADRAEVEHVIPLSKWRESDVTESAWRTGCYDCNRGAGGKFETDHSAYLLRRFKAGKPLALPRVDGLEPAHGALTPHTRGWLLRYAAEF